MDTAIKEAKAVTEITTWDQMEYATMLVNKLAELDSKEATKQFDRLTSLLAQCTVAA